MKTVFYIIYDNTIDKYNDTDQMFKKIKIQYF